MWDEMAQPVAAGFQVVAPQGFYGRLPVRGVVDAIEEVDVGGADCRRRRLTVSHSSAEHDRNGAAHHCVQEVAALHGSPFCYVPRENRTAIAKTAPPNSSAARKY